MLRTIKTLSALLLPIVSIACAATTEEDTGAATENLSTVIHTTYGVTTFGGPGDYQSLACTNQNSRNDQPWYVASSQRYGCGVHLKNSQLWEARDFLENTCCRH